jgi:hypothetical protein
MGVWAIDLLAKAQQENKVLYSPLFTRIAYKEAEAVLLTDGFHVKMVAAFHLLYT